MALTLCGCSTYIAVGTMKGLVQLWDYKKPNLPLHETPMHEGAIWEIRPDPIDRTASSLAHARAFAHRDLA